LYGTLRVAGFALADIDGNGLDEVLLTTYFGNVFWYRHGLMLDTMPGGRYHRSWKTGSLSFGTKILDVSDVTGRGYHSLLITDPDAYTNLYGASFLYNTGISLRDSCVAAAEGQYVMDKFSTTAVGVGDRSGDGRSEFIVGSSANDAQGFLAVFLGDSSYGPAVNAVVENTSLPRSSLLLDLFPNPVSTELAVLGNATQVSGYPCEITIDDILGRHCVSVFQGRLPASGVREHVPVSSLPAGTYVCRFRSGGEQATRVFAVVH
jgi:hypothetical protein